MYKINKMNKKISCSFIAFVLWATAPSLTFAGNQPSLLSVEQAVAIALQKNQTLLAARDTLLAAKQKVDSSRADLMAKGTLDMGYTGFYHQPIMKTSLGESGTAHKNTYSWGVSLRQPLFRGYALKSQVDLAINNVRDKTLAEEITRLDLARDVRVACYNLLLAGKLKDVAQSEVDSLTAHTRTAQHMYEQELIPKNDLLRSRVSLADSLQGLEQAKADVDSSRALLNRLMDKEVNYPIVIQDVDKLPVEALPQKNLGAYALSHRPLIRSLKNEIRQAEISIRLAQSDYYPNVDLVGRYEQNSGEITSLENDYTNPENASIGLEIGWTFFDWGKTKAEVNAARHQKSACIKLLRAMENQVQQELKDTMLDLGVAQNNIKTAETTLEQAIENFRITNEQYVQKIVTSTIVLDAQTDLTQAYTNYYQALYGYMASMACLNRALGMK